MVQCRSRPEIGESIISRMLQTTFGLFGVIGQAAGIGQPVADIAYQVTTTCLNIARKE